ncbi:unnamed protein product, partial [Scytosiphon promiscuus]
QTKPQPRAIFRTEKNAVVTRGRNTVCTTQDTKHTGLSRTSSSESRLITKVCGCTSAWVPWRDHHYCEEGWSATVLLKALRSRPHSQADFNAGCNPRRVVHSS